MSNGKWHIDQEAAERLSTVVEQNREEIRIARNKYRKAIDLAKKKRDSKLENYLIKNSSHEEEIEQFIDYQTR